MTTLRRESREALQFILDKGGRVVASQWAQYHGTNVQSVHRTYRVMIALGILTRKKIGPRLWQYTAVDMAHAQTLADEEAKDRLPVRKTGASTFPKTRWTGVSSVFHMSTA